MLTKYVVSFLTLSFLISTPTSAEEAKKHYRIPDDVVCETNAQKNTMFCADTNGEPITGEAVKYFEGTAIRVYNFEQGILNGIGYTYYTDGTIKSEIPYKNGRVHGVMKKYDRMGKISEKISYQNNQKEGIATYYNDSGVITAQIVYVSDEALGDMFLYDDISQTPIYRLKIHSGRILSGTYTYLLAATKELKSVTIPEIIITAINNKCLDFQPKLTTSPCAAVFNQNPECNQSWRKANRTVVRDYLKKCRKTDE